MKLAQYSVCYKKLLAEIIVPHRLEHHLVATYNNLQGNPQDFCSRKLWLE